MTKLQGLVLNAVNDLVSVRPYRGGELVTTNLQYSDGDTIRIWVDPMNGAFRVTDRAEAVDRLEMWGVRASQGRAAEAIVTARASAFLNPYGAQAEELSTICTTDELGLTVLRVAAAALRVEQLRWLAKDQPMLKFDDRLANRLSNVASTRHWKMTRRAKISLDGGRTRQVTAAIEGESGTAWIQAVGNTDQDRAVANCYYLFDRSQAPKSHRIAALAGAATSWPNGLQHDLEQVGRVTFFEDALNLEHELEQITGPALVS